MKNNLVNQDIKTDKPVPMSYEALKADRDSQQKRADMGAPGVDDVVAWAKTGRGGKVYDIVRASIDASVCSSRYGLCE